MFAHYATVLTLLSMGLSLTEVKNLSSTEANLLLAMNVSVEEYKQEQMERSAKHQQASTNFPSVTRRY